MLRAYCCILSQKHHFAEDIEQHSLFDYQIWATCTYSKLAHFFGSYEIWHYIILLKFHLGYFRTYRKILFGPVPVNCCKLITYDDRIAHSQHDHLQYINARFGLYYSPEFENRSLLCPVMCYVQKFFSLWCYVRVMHNTT